MNEQAQTFRAAFCSRYRCPEADFVRRAFWKCLRLRAWPFALVAGWCWPKFYAVDREFLEYAGRARSPRELQTEIGDFHYQLRLRNRSLKRVLRLGVSGTRVQKLAARIFP